MDLEKKAIQSMKTVSDFQLLSIDGIVRAILDRRSRRGGDVIPGERSEFHSLSIEGTFRIISTIDLEKSNTVEESDVNFTHF